MNNLRKITRMKKFLIVIFFALMIPSISNACDSVEDVQNFALFAL